MPSARPPRSSFSPVGSITVRAQTDNTRSYKNINLLAYLITQTDTRSLNSSLSLTLSRKHSQVCSATSNMKLPPKPPFTFAQRPQRGRPAHGLKRRASSSRATASPPMSTGTYALPSPLLKKGDEICMCCFSSVLFWCCSVCK